MTSDRLRVNRSGFVRVEQNKVVAIVAGDHLDDVAAALADAGVDLALVDVLQGETGARILDFDGTEHGLWAHIVRSAQKLGTASNERENYAAALHSGESVVIVPVPGEVEPDTYARILLDHGGRRIIHFGRVTRDQITF
jgi:hypothetical protein